MLTELKPIEHFKELVATAIRAQKVKTNELAEHYLSTLLASFVFSENLTAEPLAVTYIKALNAEKMIQLRLMKQLGDIALFTSGFFSDSLKRKILDVDYYILMGTASYGWLALMHGEEKRSDSFNTLFSELSGKFTAFVDVLTEVSEKSRLTSSKDVLRVYERWLRTKSKQAERLLRGLGIDPLTVSTKPIH
ncbi:MAG: hypothetical protein HY891_04775 [Deltaproteobacteria bacterium]|nr:hypothetical protein [Deltaproteobacteria bacterium]